MKAAAFLFVSVEKLSMLFALMLAQAHPIRGFVSPSPRGHSSLSSSWGLMATVEDGLSSEASSASEESSSEESSATSWHSDPSSSHYCSTSSDDVLQYWETIGTITTISSPWLTIYCERLLRHNNNNSDDDDDDNAQELLDYWRVETEHSAVIVTMQGNEFVLPKPQYRPGVGCVTLDFPGGRIPAKVTTVADMQAAVVPQIVQRELGIGDDDENNFIQDVWSVSGPSGWIINSSFSNQRLYGFVVVLRDDVELHNVHERRYNPTNRADMEALMKKDLLCLQCRHVLLEYMASCW